MELFDNFPVRVSPHIGEGEYRRFMFAEYGSHENVNITVDDDEESIKILTQKSQKSIQNLSQNIPTLPLFASPLNDRWSEWDNILKTKNCNNMQNDLKYMVNQSKTQRGILQKARRDNIVKRFQMHNKIIQNYYSSDNREKYQGTDVPFSELLSMLDKGFYKLFNTDEKVSDVHGYNPTCLNSYNRHFYGGLLSVVNSHLGSSADVLIHAGGASFQDIYMTEVSSAHGGKLRHGQILDKLTVDESVFQIVSSKQGLICARQKHKCLLLGHKSSHPKLIQKDHIEIPDEELTSVSFSSYERNEILVSTNKGGVYLWDIQSSCKNRLFVKSLDSDCIDPWSCSYFAGHSQQVAFADNTSLSVFDQRSHLNSKTELFSLSPDLTYGERGVVAAVSLGPLMHAVVTDYSIFIIDQRFTLGPVLSWRTEFKYPPQYIEVLHNVNLSQQEKLLVVASQQPPEVMCFSLHKEIAGPVVSSVLPWKVSQIGDFSQSMHTSYTCDLMKAEKRFDASLAGITVTSQPDGNGFTVYQIDGYGDIFYQPYVFNNREVYNLAICTEEERQAVDQQAKTWLKAFDSIAIASARESQIQCLPVKLAPDTMRNIFSQSEPKVNPKATGNTPVVRSAKLRKRLHRNLLPLKQLSYKGSSTQLHLALRDNADITEILLKREKDHSRMKKRVRKINVKTAKKTCPKRRKNNHKIAIKTRPDQSPTCPKQRKINHKIAIKTRPDQSPTCPKQRKINHKMAIKTRPDQSPKKRIYKPQRKPTKEGSGKPSRAAPKKCLKKDVPRRKNISKELCDTDPSSSEGDDVDDSRQMNFKDPISCASDAATDDKNMQLVEIPFDQIKQELVDVPDD